MSVRLTDLWDEMDSPRKKVLAHADLETIRKGKIIGAFREGLLEEYFHTLQELLNLVFKKWNGRAQLRPDIVAKDTNEFLRLLIRA